MNFLKNRLTVLLIVFSLFLSLTPLLKVNQAFAARAVFNSASTYGSGSLPLTDNFGDNSINSYLWPTLSNSATVLTETNNRIEITPIASTIGYASMTSRVLDFSSGQIEFDYVSTLGGGTPTGFNDQGMVISLDGSNGIFLSKGGGFGGSGTVFVRTAGVSNSTNFTDSSASQKYRIRMSGTTVYFERWNGGSTWLEIANKTVSWNLTAVTIQLYAGYWGTGNANTQKGVFDNVISSGIQFGSDTATDSDGNTYTTGSFTGTFDFDPGPGTYNLVSAGSDDIFVTKLDSDDNLVWATRLGSTGSDKGHYLSLDGSENIDIIGSFSGTVDFDPGAGTSNLVSASTDVFALEFSQLLEPTLTTSPASNISRNAATIAGEITETGGLDVETRGLDYGLTTSYTTQVSESGTFGTGIFDEDISGLTCNALYHFRAFAINDEGTSYGDDETFTTSACLAPTVTTAPATNILEISATLGGNVTDTGDLDITQRGFDYGLTSTYTDQVSENGIFGAEAFTSDVIALTCGTMYHFRAFAVNSSGTSYGSDTTFTSSSCPSRQTTGSYIKDRYANFQGLKFIDQLLLTPNPMGIPTNILNPKNNLPLITNNFEFIRNLNLGFIGDDVKKLQEFLNQNSFTLAQSGVGSPGRETTYYGPLTKHAVKIFQETFHESILAPVNLISGTGYFGPSTRNFVNSLLR